MDRARRLARHLTHHLTRCTAISLLAASASAACARAKTDARASADAALEAPLDEGAPIVAGHVIVTSASPGGLDATTTTKHHLTKERALSGGAAVYRIEGIDERTPRARAKTLEAIAELRKDPAVRSAEPDAILQVQPLPPQ